MKHSSNLASVFFGCTLTCCLAIAFASCDDTDSESYMPVYEGFSVEPTDPIAGDTITFTAVQQKKGHLIYHADYKWTVTYFTRDSEGNADTLTYTKKQSVVYDLENQDPSLEFLIPAGAGGEIQASFRADFTYSGIGSSGYDGADYSMSGVAGYIRPRASSSTFGYQEGLTRKINVAASE